MEWTYLLPSDSKPTVFPDQGSLSSHRQHGDGTYSLSSHLTVPPDLPPGTKITCVASHAALEAPLSVSLLLEAPQQGLLFSLWFKVVSVCVCVCFTEFGAMCVLYYSCISIPTQTPTGGCSVSCLSLDSSSTKLWNKWVEDLFERGILSEDVKFKPSLILSLVLIQRSGALSTFCYSVFWLRQMFQLLCSLLFMPSTY